MIVFDQQGHGRTPDTSRQMSYEQFGDDAAALLRALEVERADVMGYSQGGGVALQLAIRHPSLVNKLVSMSATFRKDGWYPSVFEGIGGLSAEPFAGTSVEKAFKEHTPDAKAFDAYLEKMKELNINDQNISDEEMRSISAKTMVIVGDADGVKPNMRWRCSSCAAGAMRRRRRREYCSRLRPHAWWFFLRCRTSVCRGSRSCWCRW